MSAIATLDRQSRTLSRTVRIIEKLVDAAISNPPTADDDTAPLGFPVPDPPADDS